MRFISQSSGTIRYTSLGWRQRNGVNGAFAFWRKYGTLEQIGSWGGGGGAFIEMKTKAFFVFSQLLIQSRAGPFLFFFNSLSRLGLGCAVSIFFSLQYDINTNFQPTSLVNFVRLSSALCLCADRRVALCPYRRYRTFSHRWSLGRAKKIGKPILFFSFLNESYPDETKAS